MTKNQTKKWMLDATIELLKKKPYSDITILNITNHSKLGRRTFYRYFKTKDEVIELICIDLINQLSDKLLEDNAVTFQQILITYFNFWEEHLESLLLLKKNHLLSYLEEHMSELVGRIARHIGHIPNDMQMQNELLNKYKYEFAYKLAGLWSVVLIWCKENPRKNAVEMSQIIFDFSDKIR